MRKGQTYRSPRSSSDRITEARSAINRLRRSMESHPSNRAGPTGQTHAEAIRRWQDVIDAETGRGKR